MTEGIDVSKFRLQADALWRISGHTLTISSPVKRGTRMRLALPSPITAQRILEALSAPIPGRLSSSRVLFEDKWACELFRVLQSKGIIILRKPSDDVFVDPVDSLFDRQDRFFNSFENEVESGIDFRQAIQKKKIAVFGLGGFGSWLVLLADRTGFGTIVGVDFDHVEKSNLPRQVLFSPSQIGLKKTKACSETLSQDGIGSNFIGIDAEVKSSEEAKAIIKGLDFVFVPFGLTPGRKIHNHVSGYVAKACIEMGVPHIFVGANVVGPLWVPRANVPCYFCLTETLDGADGTDPAGRSWLVAKRAFAPLIAASCSRAIWDAVGFLSKSFTPQTMGRVVGFNWLGLNESFSIVENSKPSECELCRRRT